MYIEKNVIALASMTMIILLGLARKQKWWPLVTLKERQHVSAVARMRILTNNIKAA
jgi:hypothetical protein